MELGDINLNTKAQSSEKSTNMRLSRSLRQRATRTLLRYGENLQSSALSEAVRRGDIKTVQQMMENTTRYELNYVDAYGMTALHYAARHDQSDIAILLLNNGASIDIKTRQGAALQTAIKNRKVATVTALLGRGASINLTDIDGMNALHLAVNHRLNVIVMKLLEECIFDVNAQDDKMNTALHYAAINDDATLCQALLDYGASVDARNSSKETPLHLAAGENNMYALRILIDADFKELSITKENFINMKRDDNKTALLLAAQMGNFEIMECLISHGADIHVIADDKKKSALHLAALSGNEDAVRMLLENSIPIDLIDNNGRMPLHDAILLEHNHIVEILLSNNAQIGHRDNEGNTPFLLAVRKNNSSLAEVFLDKGADISDQNLDLKTGLHYAVENNNYDLSLMLVERCKAVIRFRDEEGKTPLHCAAQLGYSKILKLLLSRTMQINSIDNAGETPLHLASRNGNLACVQLLIQDPKGVDIWNQDEQTALHLAAIHNKPLVCLALLNHNADVNQKDRTGWSPLFYAIYHDDLAVLKIILQHNANLNLSDTWGNTCLMVACEAGKTSVVNLLLESGADLQCVNVDGTNFFDLAIDLQRESVCRTILESSRWDEALSIRGKNGSHFMHKLIKKYPDLVEIILNRSISFSEHHPEDSAFTATFDFRFLDESPTTGSLPSGTVDKIFEKRKRLYFAPRLMFKYKRQELTNHPIVSALMEIKWNRLCRYFYYLRFFVFLVHSTLLNIYVVNKSNYISSINSHNSQNNSDSVGYKFAYFVPPGSHLFVIFIMVFVISLLQILNEVFKLLVLRHKYFYRIENYVEITLNIFAIMMLTSVETVDTYEHISMALCIFLAWTNHLLYLQGIPYYNIYAAMYLKVCMTIVKVLLLFAIIFICFIVSFHLLSLNQTQFKNLDMRVLALFTMMTGELGINEWFFSQGKGKVPFPTTTYLVMFLFLLFIVMAFTNLLIGLAVGDIESIRSSARLQALKLKIRLIDGIQIATPKYILNRHVNVQKYTYAVNRQTRFQRLVKYLLSDTIDDDLKQLRMKQIDFECKVVEAMHASSLAPLKEKGPR